MLSVWAEPLWIRLKGKTSNEPILTVALVAKPSVKNPTIALTHLKTRNHNSTNTFSLSSGILPKKQDLLLLAVYLSPVATETIGLPLALNEENFPGNRRIPEKCLSIKTKFPAGMEQ